jgi:hypothetical protein
MSCGIGMAIKFPVVILKHRYLNIKRNI